MLTYIKNYFLTLITFHAKLGGKLLIGIILFFERILNVTTDAKGFKIKVQNVFQFILKNFLQHKTIHMFQFKLLVVTK